MDQLERNKKVVIRAWQAHDKGDETGFAACVAEGDMVMTQIFTRATHTGEYFGVAPTGKRMMLHEMLICRLAGDRIVESWQITSGGFMEQLTGRKATAGDNQA